MCICVCPGSGEPAPDASQLRFHPGLPSSVRAGLQQIAGDCRLNADLAAEETDGRLQVGLKPGSQLEEENRPLVEAQSGA